MSNFISALPIILIAFGFREPIGREEAQNDHGEDADECHDNRIEKLKDCEQLFSNKIGHLEGEYEYTEPMQDAEENARREAEEENEKRWQPQADAAQGKTMKRIVTWIWSLAMIEEESL